MRLFSLVGCALATSIFGGSLAAQGELVVDSIVHEPTANEVGPEIAAMTVQVPGLNGTLEDIPIYGNGRGVDGLDTVSEQLYALGGTTTHDLVFLRNTTGADIIVNGMAGTITVLQMEPLNVPTGSSEAGTPGHQTGPTIIPVASSNVVVPAGSATAVFLVITEWQARLDTSPRQYRWTFQVNDTVSMTNLNVPIELIVPGSGGQDDGSTGGCSAVPSRVPTGLLGLVGIGMVAYIRRRQRLRKRS